MSDKMNILLGKAKAVTPCPYRVHVLETFIDHHDCLGMDHDEIQDMVASTPFPTIEKWLKAIGYDLNN